MSHRPFSGLVLAFVKDGTCERVGYYALGLVRIGIYGYLVHTARAYILLELGETDILGEGIVINIEHSEQEHYYNGICPVHAELYAALLRFVGIVHRISLSLVYR